MRFTLRAILLGLALVCLALKAGLVIKERRETRSMAECLAVANAKAAKDELGKLAPPLTEEAVLGWIEKRLAVVDDPPWVQRQLRKILRTGRLPLDARLRARRLAWVEQVWFVSTTRKEWEYVLDLWHEGGADFSMDIPASLTPATPPSSLPPSFRWWAKTAVAR